MGTGSNLDDVAADVSSASVGFSSLTLVMDGVFGFRGVGLAQRRNTDGGCMSIDTAGGGYEIRAQGGICRSATAFTRLGCEGLRQRRTFGGVA